MNHGRTKQFAGVQQETSSLYEQRAALSLNGNYLIDPNKEPPVTVIRGRQQKPADGTCSKPDRKNP
ncbi:hypothetical protein SV7mr_36800 [Stieleria bergensis]|uniref:Uncharacterized protein n=1 Tax=Stieleria bergensis TaxID=2528025 RepID=A0A517SYC6_9BACT|nr:hypothetical protein SV7mr_36800 [Planctomycetes bacterium SV_7m_r]